MSETLDRQSPRFDERNLFVLLVLGMLSVGDRFGELLRRHGDGGDAVGGCAAGERGAVRSRHHESGVGARGHDGNRRRPAPAVAAESGDDPAAYLLLGAIRLRDVLRRELSAAARDGVSASQAEALVPSASQRPGHRASRRAAMAALITEAERSAVEDLLR